MQTRKKAGMLNKILRDVNTFLQIPKDFLKS